MHLIMLQWMMKKSFRLAQNILFYSDEKKNKNFKYFIAKIFAISSIRELAAKK
jgi:hypothetical protein